MSHNGNRHDYLRVPVEISGLRIDKTAEGYKLCGFVEVDGVGRVPVCREISDAEASAFFRKALQDAKAEWGRFQRGGGLRGWFRKYFGRGT